MNKKYRALLLLSGGLDSMLAALILKRENIEVVGLNFTTGLEYLNIHEELLKENIVNPAKKAADILGIELMTVSLEDTYINMLLNPKYGYGSAINPCLDCHILMINKAKEIMIKDGFNFIATGEVKGQRPMSQKAYDLERVIKDTELNGLLLRPLCAKTLPETLVEKTGMVKRENLYGITGRSRSKQMELAREFGLTEYPDASGSGCAIVDKGYARRYYDLVEHNSTSVINMSTLKYLAIARHIRLDEKYKLILGRNRDENLAILNRDDISALIFKPNYDKGPVGMIELYNEELEKNISNETILKAIKIVGYFSKEDTIKYSIDVIPIKNGISRQTIEVEKINCINVSFQQIN